MKRNWLISLIFFLLLGCALQKTGAPYGTYDPEDPSGIVQSYADGTGSHAVGLACLNCHQPGGGSEIWLSLAGTLYQPDLRSPYPEGAIELYTKPRGRGRLLRTISVDANGNFFTTAPIDFSDSLYLTVTSGAGIDRHKPVALTDGNCNGCHGKDTERVWLE